MADIRVALRLDTGDFDRGIRSSQASVAGLGSEIRNLAAIVGVGLGTREIIGYVNAWQELQNKLRSTFEGANQQIIAFGNIKKIAGETRSSLEDVATLYSKVKISGDELKLTQNEIAQVTETFTKALKASGAGAAQTSAAILQFGQALASGRLQGDEFRSLMENSPVFMRAFAQALGVGVGDLKKLASEGAITSEVILAATLEMADGIDEKFGKTIPTISDSFTQMKNTIVENLGRMEEATGNLNKIFTFVGDNIITILKLIGTALLLTFGASIIRSIATIGGAVMAAVKAFTALRAAITGAGLAQAFMTGMTGVGLAAIAASVAAVGAAYYGMNQLFKEGDVLIEGNGKAYDYLIKQQQEAAETARQTGKEALAAGKAQAQADKDAKKAAQEAAAEARRLAKERERQLQRAKDQLISIREQTQSLKDQYNLDVKRMFLTSDEADLQQKILDIEKNRRKELADVAKLERLSPQERAAQEQTINDIFDDRVKIAKELGDAMMATRSQMDQNASLRTIRAESAAFAVDLETRKKLITEFNAFRIQQITETGRIEAEYARQRLTLESASSERIAAMRVAGDDEAIAREQASLQRTLTNLTVVRDAQIKSVQERIAAEKAFAESQYASQLGVQEAFSRGWAQAYNEYFEKLRIVVDDQASYAKRIFTTLTDGFTNSILKFVETGKLSFKDLFKTLMMEIIKMQVNKLFLSIFGKGGPMGSLFAGLFADGGRIPAGKYGIAGEAGPELIRGPANVVSTRDTAAILGGSSDAPAMTAVTYNINATDARSFKELVASDPAFIYNVTRLGARRMPR